ncbi:HamA C-terminal domain-containing protein [Undibacterium luofuense]|uniref:DUF1837 domain-containing protein n=1 Tax=Undibacterium luofuense TaxID=2828733 RepID=A0A941DJU0_9BURK|nr:DUF1837 domain-containing protein [Undibacterium luofuense]MBR7782327.1 DUF1837 domain-containing protein [Undibacterium luofuense]
MDTEKSGNSLDSLRENDKELDRYLGLISVPECENGAHRRTKLLFLRFEEDVPTDDAFIEHLLDSIIGYAIPKKKRLAALARSHSSRTQADTRPLARLQREARRLFLEYDPDNTGRFGEVGELIAYCVAERHLGAAQIAAKLSLKTNNNMPVHGIDGIHAKFEDGVMNVFWLESKLAPSANDGAKEFAISTATFLSNRTQYLRELTIVTDFSNIDALPQDQKDVLLSYFDMYDSDSVLQKRDRHVGVICYDENLYGQGIPVDDTKPPSIHEEHFIERYAKKHKHHDDALMKHLKNQTVKSTKSLAFFIAVPSVDGLRQKFGEALK